MAAPPPPLSLVIQRLLAPELDITTCEFRGMRVLVRADLNVPLAGDGTVSDRERVDAALPTLRSLAGAGARVVVASHLGRPEPGKEPEEEMRRRDSLRPVAALLAEALGDAFAGLADDCVGPSARAMVVCLQDGQARAQHRYSLLGIVLNGVSWHPYCAHPPAGVPAGEHALRGGRREGRARAGGGAGGAVRRVRA